MPLPKLKLLFLTIIIITGAGSIAQAPSSLPFDNDPIKEKSLLEAVDRRYNQDVSTLHGNYKKYIAGIYRERLDLIKEKFTKKEIITNSQAQLYLDALVQEIARSNPALKTDGLRILFSRSWWPNASSMGEGTILLNTGLFHRLQNESQAVFVICHELAHYFLNHGNDNILQYVTTLNSDEYQKQLKTIQRSEFRQNQQLEALSKNLTFKSRRHNRQFEQAADSMAIEYMKNTRYDLTEALSCLALLDSVDKDKYNTDLNLQQRFGFGSFPFNKRWLEGDDLLVLKEKDETESDSLKTHPDCNIRIQRLTPAVNKYNRAGAQKFIIGAEKFRQLQNQFDFDIPEFCFQSRNISRCLYFSLEMLEQFPDNAYLHTMVGKCLNEMYRAQKAHELGTIVDLPGTFDNKRYNDLLYFIQNVRLQEIAALSYHYLSQFETGLQHDEEFVAALIASKENFSRPDEKSKWTNFYQKNFPKGKHSF